MKILEKINIINKYSLSINDTGSVYIQIILISFKINKLNFHLKQNKKDYDCKRTLIKMINKKKKLLKYFEKNYNKDYFKFLNDLENIKI